MPEPLSPKIGFGMKVAVLPCCQATFLTMYLNFMTSSAARDKVLKRQLISAWPAVPTSWWARSTFMSRPSMMVTISSRRSPKWSVGATGK